MVSEGVDIPRLKLLVYLTNITTALFWHQAIGRIVRPGPMLGSDDSAVVYYPADPRLTALAEDITSDLNDYYNADLEDLEEQARDEGFGEPRELLPISTDDSGRVILSTKLEEVAGNDPDGRPYDQQAYDEACRIVEATGHSGDEHILAATIYALDGNIPPRPTEDEETSPIKDSYDRLRSKNNQIVKQIAYHLSEEHPLVNARLNKLVGVRSIEDADLKQLTERIRLAQQWLTTRKQPRG
jgi:type I site-specific restriction endonuclease